MARIEKELEIISLKADDGLAISLFQGGRRTAGVNGHA